MTWRHVALAAAIIAGLVWAHQPAFARGGMGAGSGAGMGGVGYGIGGGTSGRIPPSGVSGRILGSIGIPMLGASPAPPPLALHMASPMAPVRPANIQTAPSLRGLSFAPPAPPMVATPPSTFQTPYAPPCGVPPLPQC
jgi:hypothetical protein